MTPDSRLSSTERSLSVASLNTVPAIAARQSAASRTRASSGSSRSRRLRLPPRRDCGLDPPLVLPRRVRPAIHKSRTAFIDHGITMTPFCTPSFPACPKATLFVIGPNKPPTLSHPNITYGRYPQSDRAFQKPYRSEKMGKPTGWLGSSAASPQRSIARVKNCGVSSKELRRMNSSGVGSSRRFTKKSRRFFLP